MKLGDTQSSTSARLELPERRRCVGGEVRAQRLLVRPRLLVALSLGLLLCMGLSAAAGTRVVNRTAAASEAADSSVHTSATQRAANPAASSGPSASLGPSASARAASGSPAAPAVHAAAPARVLDPGLRSAAALVVDQRTGASLYAKNDTQVLPIASITKLLTALVVLEAGQPMDEQIEITECDVDRVKLSTSRLRVGTLLSRETLLQLALMASENRAASALAGAYPGGKPRFIAAMNRKASALGMTHSHFNDATGLNSGNVSTARDLVLLVRAAALNPYVRAYTTSASLDVISGTRQVRFNNTNPLLRENRTMNASMWQIGLSKTGFIEEAGHCLVMRALVAGQDVVIVLLNSQGKYTRIGDSNRVRQWLERLYGHAEGVVATPRDAPAGNRGNAAVVSAANRGNAMVVPAVAVANAAVSRATSRPARQVSGPAPRQAARLTPTKPAASIRWSEPRRTSLEIEAADGS